MSRINTQLSLMTLLLLAAAAVIVVYTAVGCGRSADDMYTEAKSLLVNGETADDGIKLLLEFERKHLDDKRMPEVLLALATAFQNKKDFDRAIETYHRLVDKWPGTAEAYKGLFLLSYLYFENVQDEEKAKSSFERFIALYPDSELTVSAKVLLDNIGKPVDEWDIVKKLSVDRSK